MTLARAWHDLFCAELNTVPVGLLSFRVDSVSDFGAFLAQQKAARQEVAELERLKRLTAAVDAPKRRRRQGSARGRSVKGKAKARAGKAGKKASLEPSAAPEPRDEDDGRVASEAESSGSDSETSDIGVRGASSSSSDAEEDAQEAPGAQSAGPEPQPARSAQQPEGLAPARPAPPVLQIDPRTGRVTNERGAYVGRISVIRAGKPSESLSVYCSLHGCSVCKSMARGVPSQAAILQWFCAGFDVPLGRQTSSQNRHKAMFPSVDQ